MRRSVFVLAPLLASTAAGLLGGCHRDEPERCVDEQNRVVDPSFCANLPPNSSQPVVVGTPGISGPLFVPHYYRNYFGGVGGSGLGSIVSGGSYAPQAGHSYAFGSGTSRGGFGSSFSAHGGESGGGE